MNNHGLPLIAIAAVVTYATRIGGLMVGDRPVPAPVERFLRYVPIAAFAALTAPGLSESDGESLPRLLGAGIAAAAVLKFGRLWLCIAVGMSVFWLSRWMLA